MTSTPPKGSPPQTPRDRPLSTLRGPSVEIDPRRVGRFITAASLVLLAVLVAVLFVTASNKNSELTLLKRAGVPVTVSVTRCVGNLSGSGSTVAGYTCRGSFSFHGQRYEDVVGGLTSYRPPGARVAAVTDPGDPNIVSTARAVATQHASGSSFVAPIILLVLLVFAGGVVAWRTRQSRRRAAAGSIAS